MCDDRGKGVRKGASHQQSRDHLLFSLFGRTVCFTGFLYKLTLNDRFSNIWCGLSQYFFLVLHNEAVLPTSGWVLGFKWSMSYQGKKVWLASHLSSVIMKKMFLRKCMVCASFISEQSRLVMAVKKSLLKEVSRIWMISDKSIVHIQCREKTGPIWIA